MSCDFKIFGVMVVVVELLTAGQAWKKPTIPPHPVDGSSFASCGLKEKPRESYNNCDKREGEICV